MRRGAYLTRAAGARQDPRRSSRASRARARGRRPGRRPRPRTGRPRARRAARPARGPGSIPSSAASSSPRSSGAGGPSRRQSSAAASICRASARWASTVSSAGEGPAAAGREAVGDGEQGDVGGDRLGRPQVLVDPARRQRHLVDEEAEPQVVQGQPLQVRGEGAAGAQPPADPADDLRPDAVVADEGDVAARARRGSPACRCRGGGRRSAARCRGVISSASGSASSRPTSAARSPAKRSRSRLDLERLLEHRQRVAVDVEVVVGALLDAAQRLQLRQDDRGEAELVEQREAAQRVGAADQLPQLGQLALAGRLAGAGRFRAGQRARCRGRSPARARRRAARRAAGAAGRRRSCARRRRGGPGARGRRGRR